MAATMIWTMFLIVTISKLSTGQEDRVTDCVEQSMTELKLCAAEYKSDRIKSSKKWDGSGDIRQCCYQAQMKECTKRVINKYCGNDGGKVGGGKSISESIAESLAVSDRRDFCSKRSAQQLADACDQGVGIFVAVIVLVIIAAVLIMLCCAGGVATWKENKPREPKQQRPRAATEDRPMVDEMETVSIHS